MSAAHPIIPPFEQLPVIPWSDEMGPANGVFGFDSRDIRSRPFNLLRSRLSKRMEAENWQTIGVVSASPGVGKTFVSCNLAAALSRSHQAPVYLVDLDLRRSSVARTFNLSPSVSLNQYLAGEVDTLAGVACRLEGEKLVLVPSLASPASSAELLCGDAMGRLIEAFKEMPTESPVICDLPPAFANDDAAVIAAKLDAYLLIIEEGQTTRKQIRDTMNLLAPAVCAGSVLNRYNGGFISDDYGYGYGHRGSYGAYYG